MGKLFGTDGIRGTANIHPITAETALLVGKTAGYVFGKESKSKRVIVGKDTRLSGYMLETAVTSGLLSMGMDVFLVGPMPTPAVAHLTRSMAAAAGFMLTASHNPADDNGIKIFGPDGYKLSDALEERIEEMILAGSVASDHIPSDQIGKAYRIEDARGRYIEFAKSSIQNQSLDGLKIVLDCANGAAYFVGPLIFRELGAEVVKMATSPDGHNINDGVGALHPEELGRMVRETGADLGVALDGDADRVIFCDAAGNAVDGDKVMGMCALELKRGGKLAKDTLVVTTMSNLGLHEAMRANGIAVEVTGVGDRQVLERMRVGGFNLGGEQSGHVIFGDYATTGDGIVTALHILAMMKKRGANLADLAAFMHVYPQRLAGIRVKAKPPLEGLSLLQQELAACQAAFGEAGRTLVRYSGTENRLRLLVECRDVELAEHWIARLTAAAEKEIGA
ncbi:MAG: phosphoglucosamine mutase [Lentisphaeria bacterium]|jgi:phosphoglucosamine mutase|nr:phosphoglucosamine mutase [Lentisphaeria bacterium]